ncbi:MAG: MFS transporter [Kiloniellales bacterium]|nr:MFS transporter [Kiloniellales bacterium]
MARSPRSDDPGAGDPKSQSPGFGTIYAALRHRNFRIYISGNAISLIGTWTQRTAVGWLTWDLTQSGFWLGLIACADLLPAVFIGPLGGVLADRLDRLRIIMAAQTVALLQAVTLFALTAGGVIGVETLALLVLVHGVAMGFNQPSRLALMPSLVPRPALSTGIAINSVVFNLARFIGPAMAGLLIVSIGVAGAFAANALSFLIFLVALSRLRLPNTPRAPRGARGTSVLAEIRDGIGYALAHPGIGPMLFLLATVSLGVRPFIDLMPGFAAEVFRGGADILAMLSSTVGLGAIASGLWIARRGPGNLTRLVLINTLLTSLAIIGFVATDILWLALISVALAGMALVACTVSMQTLMQLSVDGTRRGRVLSLYGIILIGGPAAGALIMGSLSELLGLRLPLAGGSLLALLAWLQIWQRRQAIAAALEPRSAS